MIWTVIFAWLLTFASFIIDILALLPDIPSEYFSYVDAMFGYMAQGAGFVSLFFNGHVFAALLLIVVQVELAYYGYVLVMWSLGKVPLIDIK